MHSREQWTRESPGHVNINIVMKETLKAFRASEMWINTLLWYSLVRTSLGLIGVGDLSRNTGENASIVILDSNIRYGQDRRWWTRGRQTFTFFYSSSSLTTGPPVGWLITSSQSNVQSSLSKGNIHDQSKLRERTILWVWVVSIKCKVVLLKLSS